MRELQLIERSFPGQPLLDAAISRALLQDVAAGRAPETLRLYRPDPVLAFSVLDRTRPGFARAVASARAGGFAPVLRLAGGRAAVFHRGTLAFAWSRPVAHLRQGVRERFDEMAGILVAAFRALGVDARIGAVAGEYCPGDHSVNARGRTKLAGVGQRVVRGAAHVGGVVVVRDSQGVRDALVPVYRELGLAFDPATAGSLADEVGELDLELAAEAIRREVGRRHRLAPADLDTDILARARELEATHRAEAKLC